MIWEILEGIIIAALRVATEQHCVFCRMSGEQLTRLQWTLLTQEVHRS